MTWQIHLLTNLFNLQRQWVSIPTYRMRYSAYKRSTIHLTYTAKLQSPLFRLHCVQLQVSIFHPEIRNFCPSFRQTEVTGFTICKEDVLLKHLPGKSEKRRIHSLNPDASKVSLSCCKTANPIYSGNDASPRRSLSQRWKILCNGNTSEIYKAKYMPSVVCSIQRLFNKQGCLGNEN